MKFDKYLNEEERVDEGPTQVMNKTFNDLMSAVKKTYNQDQKKMDKSISAIKSLKDKIINIW